MSFAKASLWGSVKHSGCSCLISSAVGEDHPSVTIIDSDDGWDLRVPQQQIELRFPLDDIPGGHLRAGQLLIKVGLTSEVTLYGSGSLEGDVTGTLTSISID